VRLEQDDCHLPLLVGGQSTGRLAQPSRRRDNRNQNPIAAQRSDRPKVGSSRFLGIHDGQQFAGLR
jgi:hypothetical protein